MKKADIAEFYRRLAERTPEPETELAFVNDYTLLVAVVLSAQATDAGVNLATRDLFVSTAQVQAFLASMAALTFVLTNSTFEKRIALGAPRRPPSSASPAACNGLNPAPIMRAAEMATGVPKPAAPSMNAPKENAISSAWIRRSDDSDMTECLTMSNLPVSTVSE